MKFPFPQQLASGGLRALVAAPLLVESKVFGVLIAARRAPHSFSSGECEFLRQLSEHVALAANQAEIHGALQHAYDDLRLTQEAILQQERLRALGGMASGIAHDINNALSPMVLYTDALLEREPQLSAQGRGYLKVIQRAIDGVAQTVARMREFSRQREPQLALAPIRMNRLVEQVIELDACALERYSATKRRGHRDGARLVAGAAGLHGRRDRGTRRAHQLDAQRDRRNAGRRAHNPPHGHRVGRHRHLRRTLR